MDLAVEPVAQFLPAVLAFAVLAQPGVILFLQPHTDLTEAAAEAVALAFQKSEQPAFGLHRANGQRNEAARFQRLPVTGIPAICLRNIRAGDYGQVIRSEC